MASSLVFTDSIGAATLVNGKPVPGDRFANWTPRSIPIGDSAARLSDGALAMFRMRTDFGASFDLPMISSVRVAGVAPADLADRLVFHLLNGGQYAVNTGDVVSSAYATCGLRPGTTPTLSLTDKRTIEYTLSLDLINLAGSPVRMVCRYAEQ